MKNINNYEIHPREVADKSSQESLIRAIKMALDVESKAVRFNTETFNANRYKAVKKIEDYEDLKDQARRIREASIRDLPALISRLTNVIEARGGNVLFANSQEEAVAHVAKICLSHGAKLVVKSKSITSEEIGLNPYLEDKGVEVAETDLAEFILQVSKEQPSHNVAPALHRTRESISELFKGHFSTVEPLETGEQLTEFARNILRKKFLAADIGVTGANLIAAEEGAILLVESEGNIRLCTQLPAVHIAIAGIEKIIPSKKDLGIFIELLAASATGQSLTSYTNILEPPLLTPILNLNGRDDKKREFYLVLVDNGRMRMRDDVELREALYCIRCGACMNSCPIFQAVGGHAFGGEVYTGGIGAAWTYGTTGSLQKARFAELCTGCSRCIPNCPVRIDVPQLNTAIKNRLRRQEGVALKERFFGNFSKVAKVASLSSGLSNFLASLPLTRLLLEKAVGFDRRREIPNFKSRTFRHQYSEYRKGKDANRAFTKSVPAVVLFVDIYTNYINPEVGIATIQVFEKLGIPIAVSEVLDDGRALQSQGLFDAAKRKALDTANYVANLIDSGKEIIVAEPSVLSMFRRDYRNLVHDDATIKKLADHTFDPVEYLEILARSGKLDVKTVSIRDVPKEIFFHPHCQMRTVGASGLVHDFLGRFGSRVHCSDVECCGMAGSFGYKKEFYELSRNIGENLVHEIREVMGDGKDEAPMLASGTSCREQIKNSLGQRAYHPIEFLSRVLK